MIEQLLSRENLLRSIKACRSEQRKPRRRWHVRKILTRHILQNWQTIRQAIEEGTYEPSPVVGSKSRNRTAEVSGY